METPGYYRRFSLTYWVSWHVAYSARRFVSGLSESFRWAWNQSKQDLSRRGSADPKKDRPLLKVSLAFLPIIGLTILFPRQWFLNIPVLVAFQVFFWWVLLWPLRHAPSLIRKILKIVVMTGLVFDVEMTLKWLNDSAPDPFRLTTGTAAALAVLVVGLWWVSFFWIIFARPKRRKQPVQFMASQPAQNVMAHSTPAPESHVPKICFADVGGMEEAKQQIRDVVESRLHPEKYARYGVVRNGILLYGPRGSGKTYLAEATAGEFKLNFHYVSPTRFVSMWVGETESSLRGAFLRALVNRPVLLFIDEIDALGSFRQKLGDSGDPGGAGRMYNNMTIELMQSIDQMREEPNFIVMAATNLIDGLDEALVRDGRFDVKVNVDLPDEPTRGKIFEAQLSAKPWLRFDLKEFARRTPGASAAKIRSLVDRAAVYAAQDDRKIEARDLERALQEYGGKDRPLFQPVEWDDLIVDGRVERELRTLIRLVGNPFAAEKLGLQAPMGVLLLGPPGTGKTMIGRLIATQAKRSFLPITSADITEPKAITKLFARARENSPSLIFIDEMDSLVPANQGYLNQYYVQIVEQFLIEISNLQPEHNVFLVATTNHPENIDPRILRGGRFSEKIEIGAPGSPETRRLLDKYLKSIKLESPVGLDYLTEWFTGITPANLEAMIATAKRYAFERSGVDKLAPLSLADFDRAAERVLVQAPVQPRALSNKV
ncbi:MAG TPA: AAA family ATPase [Terriglobia bacterium]|nr:AAA family ATPase [Terriglobia bacterium]